MISNTCKFINGGQWKKERNNKGQLNKFILFNGPEDDPPIWTDDTGLIEI